MPADLQFQTELEIALAMLAEILAIGRLPFRWVTADEHFGEIAACTCLASSGSWERKQAQRPEIDVRWSLTNASSRDTPCWRQVTKTLAKIECAKAPRAVRLQPVVFRIMTAGRSMRSA